MDQYIPELIKSNPFVFVFAIQLFMISIVILSYKTGWKVKTILEKYWQVYKQLKALESIPIDQEKVEKYKYL